MTFKNNSNYPTDEVRRLVKFAVSEVDMRGVHVVVENSRRKGRWSGTAYRRAFKSAPPSARRQIVLRLPDPGYLVGYSDNGYRKRSPARLFADWRECLVSLAAHEAKHIEQFKERLKVCEIACEYFALYMQNLYKEQAASEEAA